MTPARNPLIAAPTRRPTPDGPSRTRSQTRRDASVARRLATVLTAVTSAGALLVTGGAAQAAQAQPAQVAQSASAAAAATQPAQQAPSAPTAPADTRVGGTTVARPGSVGAIVSSIDRALRASEIRNFGKPTRTGAVAVRFGPQTQDRVKSFQRRNKLPVTGVVDERTYNLLRPATKLTRGLNTVGRSVQGRAIQVRVVGNLATAKRRVLLMGCVHGNECEGVPVLRSIANSTPPAGVAYVIFTYPNPDGRTAGTRGNARGVDLNRNAIGWQPASARGNPYYPGTGPLSEPESVAIHDVFRAARPTAFMSFHQALRCIDFSGRGKQWAGTYARISGLPVKELSAYRGSIGTWVGNRYPSMVSLTVELPRPVPAWMIDSNIAAVKRVATRH